MINQIQKSIEENQRMIYMDKVVKNDPYEEIVCSNNTRQKINEDESMIKVIKRKRDPTNFGVITEDNDLFDTGIGIIR